MSDFSSKLPILIEECEMILNTLKRLPMEVDETEYFQYCMITFYSSHIYNVFKNIYTNLDKEINNENKKKKNFNA